MQNGSIGGAKLTRPASYSWHLGSREVFLEVSWANPGPYLKAALKHAWSQRGSSPGAARRVALSLTAVTPENADIRNKRTVRRCFGIFVIMGHSWGEIGVFGRSSGEERRKTAENTQNRPRLARNPTLMAKPADLIKNGQLPLE